MDLKVSQGHLLAIGAASVFAHGGSLIWLVVRVSSLLFPFRVREDGELWGGR